MALCKLLILQTRLDLLILQMWQKAVGLLTKCGTSETIETRPNGKRLKTWSHAPGLNRRPADYETSAATFLGLAGDVSH
jgi:hypothetical protein